MPLEQIIAKHGTRKDALIPILQEVQKEYRYLPREVLQEIDRRTEITAADIFGVSTFYDQFRHTPVGEHIISVCTGTACHVKGADRILERFYQVLNIPDGDDTDPLRQFTVQKAACLGCCTLAPVVQIDGITYGHLTAAAIPEVLDDFLSNSRRTKADSSRERILPSSVSNLPALVRIGIGSCCQAQGSGKVMDEAVKTIRELGLDIRVEGVGCIGMCHQTPMLEIVTKNNISKFYAKVKPEDVRSILLQNDKPKNILRRIGHSVCRCLEKLWSDEFPEPAGERQIDFDSESVRAFMERQRHIATRGAGNFAAENLNDYCNENGFEALKRVLKMPPERIIERVKESGLRGRGGAGFPTWRKWESARAAERAGGVSPPLKYVVCNGDEGDPGAFMDRMLLESFPFRIIEGMTIAAKAVGSNQGYFYIRAEYPLAVKRVRSAIDLCYKNNLLGENILSSGFSFDLSVKEGAGAFICGEETALLESMEGRRGMPRLKPPFPAEAGLFGLPTLINNVETFAAVPQLFVTETSAADFASLGTEKSKGTKVFALAGKIKRGGLIEVPMGITLRQIVAEIGGSPQFKAVQIGGPSGGCVPAALADVPVDFESLAGAGAIMGSGGLVVLDDSDCMVDIARYFLHFTQEQSCGKCTFCRIGTRRMLDILNRLCEGRGMPEDLPKLELLAEQVKAGSLCGLGKTAPNPVLSTLRYFRNEYEAHVRGECPAGKCRHLIEYRIGEKCSGCSICVRHCPVSAIQAVPYRKHRIDVSVCTKCDACRLNCPHDAVAAVSPIARFDRADTSCRSSMLQ